MYSRWLRNSFIYLLILVAVIAIVFSFFQPGGGSPTKDLGTVIQDAKTGQVKQLEIQGDTIKVKEPSQFGNWLGLLINFLPLIIFGAILLFMMRQAQGSNSQAMSFGKSRARMFTGNKPTVTFSDVAGVDESKEELQEVVEFLKFP